MKIFEILRKFFNKKKDVKLLKSENKRTSNNDKETFKKSIKHEQYEEIEITYYEAKILQTIKEFKKLFLKILEEKDTQISSNNNFTAIAIETKKHYPNISKKIDNVLYYYSEEQDSEEKLESMMKLYQAIKEKVNES